MWQIISRSRFAFTVLASCLSCPGGVHAKDFDVSGELFRYSCTKSDPQYVETETMSKDVAEIYNEFSAQEWPEVYRIEIRQEEGPALFGVYNDITDFIIPLPDFIVAEDVPLVVYLYELSSDTPDIPVRIEAQADMRMVSWLHYRGYLDDMDERPAVEGDIYLETEAKRVLHSVHGQDFYFDCSGMEIPMREIE